jgi:hypothetical protein
LDKVLDETKKNINKTTNEAKREVSRFAKTIGDLQEQTIQTTKAIGYELVHLQKEAISTQSAYLPYIERSYALSWTPWISPRIMSEVYTRMVDNFVDNAIATTNLVNNMFLTNMETIQFMMDTTRDYFKLGTDSVKSFKDTLTNPNTNNWPVQSWQIHGSIELYRWLTVIVFVSIPILKGSLAALWYIVLGMKRIGQLESFTHNVDDLKISYNKQDTIDIILTATKMNHWQIARNYDILQQ